MADLVCKAGTHKVAHQDGEKTRFRYICEPDAPTVPAWTGAPASAPSSAASSYASNDCSYELLARGWKKICYGK